MNSPESTNLKLRTMFNSARRPNLKDTKESSEEDLKHTSLRSSDDSFDDPGRNSINNASGFGFYGLDEMHFNRVLKSLTTEDRKLMRP